MYLNAGLWPKIGRAAVARMLSALRYSIAIVNNEVGLRLTRRINGLEDYIGYCQQFYPLPHSIPREARPRYLGCMKAFYVSP